MEVKTFDNTNAPIANIVNLLHFAFTERIEAGLNFDCANFSEDDYIKETEGGVIFCAFVDDQLVGTVFLRIYSSRGLLCGNHEFLATSPNFKKKGIATLLQSNLVEYAKSKNLCYISSTTATNADSSVAWHKKNGFVPYYVMYLKGKTYYSYMFFKPLRKRTLFKLIFLFAPVIRFVTFTYVKRKYKLQRI